MYYLSLGAGRFQAPLIHAAQKLGLQVIGVDPRDAAPARSECDIFIQRPLDDAAPILDDLQTLGLGDRAVSGVYARTYGSVHKTVAELAEALRLPAVPWASFQGLSNKQQMRSRLDGQGKHHVIIPPGTQRPTPPTFAPPWIVKPAEGFAKQDVFLCNGPQEWAAFWQARESAETKEGTEAPTYLAEAFINGPEISAMALVVDGQVQVVHTSTKFVLHPSPFLEILHVVPSIIENYSFHGELAARLKTVRPNDHGSDFVQPKLTLDKPAAYTLPKLTQTMQNIAEVYALDRCVLLGEFRLAGGEFHVIEAVCEVGGEYLADFLIPQVRGIDYFEQVVRLTCRPGTFGGQQVLTLPSKVHNQSYGIVGFALDRRPDFEKLGLESATLKIGSHGFYYENPAGASTPEDNRTRKYAFGIQAKKPADIFQALDRLNYQFWGPS